MKHSRTLTRKLVAVTVLFTVILLSCVAVCYLVFYRQCVEEQAMKYTQESLDTAAYEIDSQMAALMDSQTRLSYENEVTDFLSADTEERFEHRKAIRSLLNSYVNNRDMVRNIFLRTVDGTRVAAEISTADAYYDEFKIYCTVTAKIDLSKPFRGTQIAGVYPCSDGRKMFCLVTPVFNKSVAQLDRDYLGALISVCAADELGSFLASNREVAIYEGEQLVFARQSTETEQPERILSCALDTADWMLYMSYSLAEVTEKLNEVAIICLVVAGMILFGQTCLFFTLYHSLLRPVKSIADQVNAVGTFTDRIVEPTNSIIELHRMTSSINNMLRRMEIYNETILQERAKQYEATILLLQAQINPHFLYNNLQCIRGMAALGNDQAIREMVENIAAIYRYCSQTASTATLEEEIECAQMYMRIMELRYDASYRLVVECPSESRRCHTPRMVLQPLMENSIRHGFKGRENGQIIIRACEEQNFLICTVSDDGCGMNAEMLEKARTQIWPYEEKNHRYHIGLGNVRSRIKLIFGGKSGLDCQSAPGAGTVITIRIQQKK